KNDAVVAKKSARATATEPENGAEAKPVSKGNGSMSGSKRVTSTDVLLKLYRDMLRIRRFEEAALVQYQRQAIGGFCHLYIGQEAVAVGALSCLEKGDKGLTALRRSRNALG